MNLAFVAKQYRTYGFVTDSIVFITAVQALYILDGIFMEPAILTTMDITSDGFGMMLSFGDLVWVPFMYTTQVRYLATNPVSLGPAGLAVMGATLLTGYSIFRLANSQKNTFRTNPDDPRVAHLKYIQTKQGSPPARVGAGGGVARHINYLGDWIQSWPLQPAHGLRLAYAILTAGTGADGAFIMADGREPGAGAWRRQGLGHGLHLLLHRLLCRPASAPRKQRRGEVSQEVRRGLGELQKGCAMAHRAWRLLSESEGPAASPPWTVRSTCTPYL